MTLMILMGFTWAVSPLPDDDCTQWEELPIRQMGRVKPLYVHAQESLKFLTGQSHGNGKRALTIYCHLSLSGFRKQGPLFLSAPIEHVKLRELLGLTTAKKIPYSQLLEQEQPLQMALRKEKNSHSSYEKALNKALGQMALYQDIRQGNNWMIPHKAQGTIQWSPLSQFLPGPNPLGEGNPMGRLLEQGRMDYQALHGNRHLVELFYAKSQVHQITLGVILISIFLLVLLKNPLWGLVGASFCILIQTAAIVLRIFISGRGPITNMYETVLFSGLGALVISLIIGHFRQEKIYVLSGLSYNLLTTLMINFAHSMLSGDISPLVPVLRDNFWLSTHVTTVILSYAAFALSWILANMALLKRRFVGLSPKEFRYQSDLIYTCLKVGTVLLALGIILGGVWADYSWGRFWGWDPKETWSAIALCIYLALLHGRYTRWIGDNQFVPAIAAAFMSIMMAWFGVNYILASGLHSYGFSEGGAIFLISFFSVQILILMGTTFFRKEGHPTHRA